MIDSEVAGNRLDKKLFWFLFGLLKKEHSHQS